MKHGILYLLSFEFTLVHQLALEYLQVFKLDIYIYNLAGSYFRILLSLDYSLTQMKRANIIKDMLFLSVTDKQGYLESGVGYLGINKPPPHSLVLLTSRPALYLGRLTNPLHVFHSSHRQQLGQQQGEWMSLCWFYFSLLHVPLFMWHFACHVLYVIYFFAFYTLRIKASIHHSTGFFGLSIWENTIVSM